MLAKFWNKYPAITHIIATIIAAAVAAYAEVPVFHDYVQAILKTHPHLSALFGVLVALASWYKTHRDTWTPSERVQNLAPSTAKLPIAMLLCVSLLAANLSGCAIKSAPGPAVPQAPEKTWRDIIAASHGVISREQETHLATCQANPQQSVCAFINKAGAAENIAKDALSAYCQFQPGDTAKVCTPVPALLPNLRQAMGQLGDLTAQLQVLTGAEKQ